MREMETGNGCRSPLSVYRVAILRPIDRALVKQFFERFTERRRTDAARIPQSAKTHRRYLCDESLLDFVGWRHFCDRHTGGAVAGLNL